jgi:hypothetical protein
MFNLFRSKKPSDQAPEPRPQEQEVSNSNVQQEVKPEPSATQRLAMQTPALEQVQNTEHHNDQARSFISESLDIDAIPINSVAVAPVIAPATIDNTNEKSTEQAKVNEVSDPIHQPVISADQIQTEKLLASAEDVRAAYKMFLGRLPETEEVIQSRVGIPVSVLMLDFLICQEFINHPQKQQIILGLAKKIIDQRKAEQENSKQEGASV